MWHLLLFCYCWSLLSLVVAPLFDVAGGSPLTVVAGGFSFRCCRWWFLLSLLSLVVAPLIGFCSAHYGHCQWSLHLHYGFIGCFNWVPNGGPLHCNLGCGSSLKSSIVEGCGSFQHLQNITIIPKKNHLELKKS